jgi:hypothetical protein
MISEVDLRDWEHLDATPLYRVPRNTYIKLGDKYFFFERIDGMYSFCLDLTNNVYHIMCTDPVIPLRKPV